MNVRGRDVGGSGRAQRAVAASENAPAITSSGAGNTKIRLVQKAAGTRHPSRVRDHSSALQDVQLLQRSVHVISPYLSHSCEYPSEALGTTLVRYGWIIALFGPLCRPRCDGDHLEEAVERKRVAWRITVLGLLSCDGGCASAFAS